MFGLALIPDRARALKFSELGQHGVRHIFIYQLYHFEALVRPCRDYDWPSFTSNSAEGLKFLDLVNIV